MLASLLAALAALNSPAEGRWRLSQDSSRLSYGDLLHPPAVGGLPSGPPLELVCGPQPSMIWLIVRTGPEIAKVRDDEHGDFRVARGLTVSIASAGSTVEAPATASLHPHGGEAMIALQLTTTEPVVVAFWNSGRIRLTADGAVLVRPPAASARLIKRFAKACTPATP